MFSSLQEKLELTFKKLRGHGKISESNVTDALREIRLALLEADVEFKVSKDLIEAVRSQALGQEVLRSVSPGQQIVKIFHDELVKLLGAETAGLNLADPQRLLIVGLNGAGKTTTSGKLAALLKKQGKRPLLIACDVFRPAAVKQLAVLGEQIGVPVYQPAAGEKDPVKVAKDALKWIEQQGGGTAIFDTAGRQEIDKTLLEELVHLRDAIQPKEVLLVADAATGQQAVNVATTFHEAVGITGLIMTRLDGDARGGAVLSMKQVTGQPIKFIGVGEKIDQFEVFHPDRMAQRILGMGDVVSLVEKAAEQIDEAEAMRMAKRMEENKFDFTDFLNQMKFMRKLGPLESLMGMLPGMSQMKDVNVDENRIKHVEAIILSMTPGERSKPEIINGSRRKRIANGSGRSVMEVNQLLKQFDMMRSMMKNKGMMKSLAGGLMGGKGLKDIAASMGGGGGMPNFPGMGGGKMGKPKKPKQFRF